MARNFIVLIVLVIIAVVGYNYYQNSKKNDVRIELPGHNEVQVEKPN